MIHWCSVGRITRHKTLSETEKLLNCKDVVKYIHVLLGISSCLFVLLSFFNSLVCMFSHLVLYHEY